MKKIRKREKVREREWERKGDTRRGEMITFKEIENTSLEKEQQREESYLRSWLCRIVYHKSLPSFGFDSSTKKCDKTRALRLAL